MKFLNERGQAALVDSLFFIAIVSAICTGLFYYAINYGLGSESLLNSFYSSDFAMDSLKVITYVNVMRDGSAVSLNSPVEFQEYDYLLALLKEDFAQNKLIGEGSRKAIANTLYSVLKPFDDSIDYAFFITKEGTTVGEAKFIALIIAAHVPGPVTGAGDYCEPNTTNCYSIKRVFYSCDPTEKTVLEKYIFPNVGKVDSAMGKITLPEGEASSAPYVIGLHTWVSKRVDAMSNENLTGAQFHCTVIEGVNVQQP